VKKSTTAETIESESWVQKLAQARRLSLFGVHLKAVSELGGLLLSKGRRKRRRRPERDSGDGEDWGTGRERKNTDGYLTYRTLKASSEMGPSSRVTSGTLLEEAAAAARQVKAETPAASVAH
jgi:hypothetical protein